jgi:hypothetical protein
MLAIRPPTTKESIEKHLGSGSSMVKGIGPKRRKRIKQSWDEQKVTPATRPRREAPLWSCSSARR